MASHCPVRTFHVKQLQTKQLEQYANLIRRYHRTLDLMSGVAVEGLEEKFADSLAYADFMRDRLEPQHQILDVGSGVGLPGIPLAIQFPNYPITLVERRQKRAGFLKIVVSQLELENVTVVAEDVTSWQQSPVTWVTAQAVGRLFDLYCLTHHLHAESVVLMSRKGDVYMEEVAELREKLSFSNPDLSDIVSRETVSATPLRTHGTLVAISLPGGLHCRLSE